MKDPVALLARLPGRFPDAKRWLIAYSGGLDSQVLLAAAADALPQSQLLAVHVHHGLQAAGDDWAASCQRHSNELNIDFQLCRVAPQSSSEAAARDARYQAFSTLMQPGDVLLMAHHANDQAETLLYRLIRGAGVAGLSAMPVERSLGQGRLVRPLLSLTRNELEGWAKQRELRWVEDPSNTVQQYARNYLRHTVMPAITQRWPGAVSRFVETAGFMAEARELLDVLAEQDAASCLEAPEVLQLPVLSQLSDARQNNLLRYWLHSHQWVLGGESLRQLRCQFLQGKANPERLLQLQPDLQLRTYRERLFLWRPSLLSASLIAGPLTLQPGDRISLAGGVLQVEGSTSADSCTLQLKYRQGGERLRPANRGVGISLSQLFQEVGVPPWLRDSWPLLCDDSGILVVPGICEDQRWQGKSNLSCLWQPFGLSGEPFFC
ncbi:tRNA lysidine(34) synthetase TilS [Nitrincola sp.]|uniref:tRNA lysidine(34) synthetase TilS n=1 Tax=Nitrincola sp. TaxID=1926584 RepID=UPI003A8D6C8C